MGKDRRNVRGKLSSDSAWTNNRTPTNNKGRQELWMGMVIARGFDDVLAMDLIGHQDARLARRRSFRANDGWSTSIDVVLDVWPEVFAWGVLVVPKDLKSGE